MDDNQRIAEFLEAGPFAVAGASNDPSKYGNKVVTTLVEAGFEVFPVNPREESIEGLVAYPDLASVPADPAPPRGVSIITPPAITERIVEQAAAAGIPRVWMQPGAESEVAVARARELGLEVIAGGPCILVAVGNLRASRDTQ